MNAVNTTRWGHVEILSRDFTSAELDAAIQNNHPHAAKDIPPGSFVTVLRDDGGIIKAIVSIPSHRDGILIQNMTAKASVDRLFERIARFFIDDVPRLTV